MDAAVVIATLAKIIKIAVDVGPDVIKTVENAKPFAQEIYELLRGKDVTAENLSDLEARVDSLAAQLQEPLPPE